MRVNSLNKASQKLLFILFLAIFGLAMEENSFADSFHRFVRNNADGSQTLTGHIPGDINNSIFRYHASQSINAQIILPLADQTQLNSFLQDLYDPKSTNFHHFLTPAQFSQQFAVSTIDSITVQDYLRKKGIIITGQSPNGVVLYVTGNISAFEQAFGMRINYYQRNDNVMFFAPDADPTIPAILAGKILAVGGLDNIPKYRAHRYRHSMKVLPQAIGTGPGGFLAPNDVKTAYNLNSVTSTGSGQSVALFELDGYSSNDITAYETYFGLSGVPLQNIYIDGFNGTPDYSGGGADEVTLDIELVAAFAPGSSNIFVYEAPNTTQAWIDEWTQIATDNKAKVISCSWGEPEMDSPTINFDNLIFEQMAAQGQAVFVAAGDNGAYDAGGNSILAVDEPASQPYATAVGISKLAINANGTYKSESASVYGGGGVSAYWTIPSYQTAVAAQAVAAAKVSTTMRNMPDVVLTADSSTPYAFYIDGSWYGYFGSSLSSPIWASFISRVNQGLGTNAPIGSVNSALYQLAQTSGYANDFHDIISGNNGYYPAEGGFDDATGLGSFNGQNLYNDLVKGSVAVSPPSAPAGLSAVAGNTGISLSWSASPGATSYNVKRSAVNGGPYTTIASTVVNTTYTDTSLANDTTYYYVVSAVNSGGESSNSAQASARYSVLPTVSLSANNSAYTSPATIVLTATASETNGGISKVLFYNGSTLLATVTSSPYTYTWSNVPAGNYSLTAEAFDNNNNTAASSAVVISVNLPPSLPTVSLTSPFNGSSFNDMANVFISANASEANGTIAQVQFFSGTTLLYTATSSPYNYTWSTIRLLPGNYNLTAQATDSRGIVVTSAAVPITISLPSKFGTTPPSPVVAITSPSNASNTPAGSSLIITANASEANGSIAEVYFYNGSAFLGARNVPPYSYTWGNIPVGSYTLTAEAIDANGRMATSNPITVTAISVAPAVPVITTNPVNQTVTAPAPATFAVSASGTPAPTYQWMQSVGGGSYAPVSGATSASYTIPATTVSQSGTLFECVVTNASGTVTSNAASLTVYSLPSITAQPSNQTVTAPAAASFSVIAGGTPAPGYQWQVSTNAGASFSNISGATGAAYTTPATSASVNGTQYRCAVTNMAGSVTSNAATLSVNIVPSITSQPVNQTVTAPATAMFSVTATGTPAPSYQWMQSVNGGAFSAISGATSASYTTPATTVSQSGTLFECVVTNASGSMTSNAASLTVHTLPGITAQPASQIVTVPATATFTVAASGTPAPSYQWMQSVNGGAFSAISGANAASYTTPATTIAQNGTLIECVVSNAAGSVTSITASLTVNPAPAAPGITLQPANQTVTTPAPATFSVTATGTPAPSYQWMQSVNGGAYTPVSGATGASYTIPATSVSQSGTLFECVVTNASGTVTSNPASLTVNPAPVIQQSLPTVSLITPSNNSVNSLLSPIVISANASETNGTITQVQFFIGTMLIYTTNNSPYSFTWKVSLLPGTYTLTAKAYDSNGNVTTSAPVIFTIKLPY